MPKCIIHVGMHNTDTPAIQHSLQELDDGAFYYARLPKSPNHSMALFSLFSGTPNNHPLNRKRKVDAKVMQAQVAQGREALNESIKAAAGRTLLISGEGIIRLERADLERLRSFFARHGYDVDIVAYVRAPVAFATSAFLGFIKAGNARRSSLNKLYPNYQQRFAKFDEVFGRANTHLWPFDPSQFEAGSVVRDFCKRLGISLSSIAEVHGGDAPSREPAAMIYQYTKWAAAHELAVPAGREASALFDALRKLGQTPLQFSPGMIKPVLEANAADIAWMEQRLGQKLVEDLPADAGLGIASEDDLLAPVPNAAAVVQAALTDAGVTERFEGADAVFKMIQALLEAGAAAPRKAAAGSGPAAPRKARPRKPDLQHIQKVMPRLWNNPISDGPRPLLNGDKKLTVLWSPKSACTTVYVWFSHLSGFAQEVRDYAAWPHRHRVEQYQVSKLYAESLEGDLDANQVLRIIRDPYGRAVSIYRHALQTDFADKELGRYQGGRHDSVTGYSFQDFLDFVATLNMAKVDIHFRPQFHPYEGTRTPDRIVNISKQNLFTELNSFEAQLGWTPTRFEELNWLHDLEGKRKAKQEPMAGEALDEAVFNRKMVSKLGQFPSYEQLLTSAAREKIAQIYKVDFDAYGKFL